MATRTKRYAAMPLSVLISTSGGGGGGAPAFTCAITNPAPGASLTEGVQITITGTISAAGTVTVKKGATTLGAATMVGLNWSYSYTPVTVDAGSLTINATATATSDGSTADATGVGVTVAALNLMSFFTPSNVLQSVQSNLGVTSSGGFVDQWADQSGNGKHYTQTSTKRPSLSAGLRGNPGILLDGVDDLLQSNLNLPAPGTTPTWMGAVFRYVTYTAGARLFTDNAGTGHTIYSPGTPAINMVNGVAQVSAQNVPLNHWECTEALFTNGADYLRRGDCAQLKGGTPGNLASTGRCIGAQGTGVASWANIEVLHVIYLSAAPSAAQVSAWREAVRTKYGSAVRVGATAGIGAVATRQRQSSNVTAALPYAVHTFHKASTAISRIRVGWANYYGVAETGTGGVLTAKASIEYPLGTRIGQLMRTDPVTGVTSATGTAQSGDDLIFDDCDLSATIPAGATFYINASLSGANGIACTPGAGQIYAAGGDAIEQTATDKTMSGTVVNGSVGFGIFPSLIVGATSKSVVIAGDSRVHGSADITDASGDLGELERSFGPTQGCINIAQSGDTAYSFGGNSANITRARRLALASYGTHFVGNWGINDLASVGRTAAQLQTDIQTIRNYWAGLPFYGVTVAPTTTGAWTATDGSDQTAHASSAARLTYNAALPGLGFTGVYDTVGPSKLSSNANKWNANGVAGKYTADGVHETPYANSQYNFPVPT